LEVGSRQRRVPSRTWPSWHFDEAQSVARRADLLRLNDLAERGDSSGAFGDDRIQFTP
jgi:hypothetical protein